MRLYGYSGHPPTRLCPQMTQITQIHTKKNICVNLRDLRENSFSVQSSRKMTSGLTFDLAASGIRHPASGI
jgi:hypothetical protein